jgi:hypothetical protein
MMFRLPNETLLGTDLVRDEPHLLRLLDQMALKGESHLRLTATIIRARIGLAISSCHGLLKRLQAAGIATLSGILDAEAYCITSPGVKTRDRILSRNARHSRYRDEAHAGRWTSKRLQRIVYKWTGRFREVDTEWSAEIERRQLEQGIGALDPGEMLAAWHSVHGRPLLVTQ